MALGKQIRLGKQVVENILSDGLNCTGEKHTKGIYSKERNCAIICRLYYHCTIKGLNYELAVQMLTKDFFLSELRLAQIIMLGRDNLKQLKLKNADKKYLTNRFPHFNWN